MISNVAASTSVLFIVYELTGNLILSKSSKKAEICTLLSRLQRELREALKKKFKDMHEQTPVVDASLVYSRVEISSTEWF